jgi:Raf kinase inhibitor-like YbhB/YbcL family protein
MELHSSSFKAGSSIPAQFTCEGDNISPALSWTDAPKDTKSFVLMVEDPDAPKGTWTHWVAYNIPANANGLPSGADAGYMRGTNDFGKTGYGGPCPPPGNDHRYFFHLFALKITLDLPDGASKADVEKAMKNHILDHAQIMGRFGRR